MGPGTKTFWQHDGRILANGDVTFFDDGSDPPEESQSRAVRIALDQKAHAARLVSSFTHPSPPLLAASQGNAQTLASGNTVVGYGGVPLGERVLEERLAPLRRPLRARPALLPGLPLPLERRARETPPAAVASLNNTAGETIVRMSWNGATGVASWRVLAGKRSRLARRAGDGPLDRLRDGDDPAEGVHLRRQGEGLRHGADERLRRGAGARLRRARHRYLAPDLGEDVRRVVCERRMSTTLSSRPFSASASCVTSRSSSCWSCSCWGSSSSCSSWCSSRLRPRIPPSPVKPPRWPVPRAWRSIAFDSFTGLQLSCEGSARHSTRRLWRHRHDGVSARA